MKIFLTACLALACLSLRAQEKMDCPMHQSAGDPHSAGVDERGDHAMGFSHQTTKHHFELLADGGIIQVDANGATDAATRDQIRQHLTHITSMFRANNFDVPMFIHNTVPPGVAVMKEKHGTITYIFMQTPQGAMIRIITHDPESLKAVHKFLEFQIQDHRTGDSVVVAKPSQPNLR